MLLYWKPLFDKEADVYQMFSGMYIYNTHIVVVKRIGFVAVVYITILSIEAYWVLVVNY